VDRHAVAIALLGQPVRQGEPLDVHRDLAGVELAEVEDAIDELQEAVAAACPNDESIGSLRSVVTS
jgi:hypothetical protein